MISTSDGETYEDATAHALGVPQPVTASSSTASRMPRQAPTEPAGEFKSEQGTPVARSEEGPKKLYIIRHGSTDMNGESNVSTDRIRGWKDVPLNDEGRQDAEKAGQKLSQMEPPTVMHHSDLDRASETAGIISKHIDTPTTASRDLRPWDLGELTGKSTKEAIPQIEDYVKNKPDQAVPKGESFNEFKERAFKGIYSALNSGDSPVAIVTHHRLERLLEAWDKKGQPADHSIDIDTFTQKGDPPGGIKEMDIKSMTHQPEDKSWGEAKKTRDAIVKHFRNTLMEGPDLMRDFMEGKTSSEDPTVGARGLGVAFQQASQLSPFASKNALGIFGGRLSPGAKITAQGLEKAGVPEEAIKRWTGLERGAEGMWRKEISDEGSKFAPQDVHGKIEHGEMPKSGEYELGDILHHPKLYETYPELEKFPVDIRDLGNSVRGTYMPRWLSFNMNAKDHILLNSQLDPKQAHSTLLHEIQHAIQDKEKFSIGVMDEKVKDQVKGHLIRKLNSDRVERVIQHLKAGEEDKAKQVAEQILRDVQAGPYRFQAHEVEARNVQARRGMTKEDITRSLGKDTEDIDRENQIIYGGRKENYIPKLAK